MKNIYIPLRTASFIVLCIGMLTVMACKQNAENGGDHRYTNALINETSPYLLQHAHNPVDWRPWSKEALQEAKETDKLVLVSIGYSSCHWCHVMEKETFEDEAVAKLMNENYINIKVDREERPDVDQVYMTALQLLKGQGGWPLNVITLPNGKPLYGGTYHTKSQWNEVLTEMSKLYKEDPEKAYEYGDLVAEGIQEVNLITPTTNDEGLTAETLLTNVTQWKQQWDMNLGGDQGSEKFMLPGRLDFLMDYAVLAKDEQAKTYVKTTLDNMLLGGVYDHVGGGFFRYSTDAFWKIPHFEKMLYDNAQLIGLYAKAYKIFQEPSYKAIVFEISEFLEREMRNPNGGYYAALDADSEGKEGKFYSWQPEELQSVIGQDYPLFSEYYNIKASEIWEENTYVLFRKLNNSEFAAQHELTIEALREKVLNWRSKLLDARSKRIRPNLDDKILTSWNALLIEGYLEAYTVFQTDAFLNSAIEIFDALKQNNLVNGALVHSFKENSKQTNGFLEDYTYLTSAALNLYGVTLDPSYLQFAETLQETTQNSFRDEASGMYRYNQDKELIATLIKTDDGVIPSPNAVMADNLFRLGHIQYNTAHLDEAKQMVGSMLPFMNEHAENYTKWGTVFLHMAYPYYEIAAVGGEANEKIKELHRLHLPNTLIVGSSEASSLPLFENRFVPEETFIYVCQNSTCKLPVTTTSAAVEQLRNF